MLQRFYISCSSTIPSVSDDSGRVSVEVVPQRKVDGKEGTYIVEKLDLKGFPDLAIMCAYSPTMAVIIVENKK